MHNVFDVAVAYRHGGGRHWHLAPYTRTAGTYFLFQRGLCTLIIFIFCGDVLERRAKHLLVNLVTGQAIVILYQYFTALGKCVTCKNQTCYQHNQITNPHCVSMSLNNGYHSKAGAHPGSTNALKNPGISGLGKKI